MSSAATLSKLLDQQNVDIAFITEHKLFQHSKYFMNTVNSIYSNITVCDSNTEVYGKLRCGKGGVSIMYKNALEFAIREMAEVTYDRIAGVEIFPNSNTSTRLYVFCVYMPSANYSIDVYLDYLNTLYALYNSYSEVGTVVFLGDMNAEIIHSGKGNPIVA